MSATIVIQFGEGADASALVRVELDGVANVDAAGQEKTSFVPGDQPVFLVHHDATLAIGSVSCSSGMVQDLGVVSRTRTKRIEWIEGGSQDLDYIPAAPPDVTWYGTTAALSLLSHTLTRAGTAPAVCDLTSPVSFRQFRVIPPDVTLGEGEEWPILIVITMEAV
jgi:hypothetical protein